MIVSSGLNFYPRSPCGERRYWSGVPVVGRSISIHALLAESDNINSSVNTADQISIHALLAESDVVTFNVIASRVYISIHALLAESDLWDLTGGLNCDNFYPRSPCGERRKVPLLGIK